MREGAEVQFGGEGVWVGFLNWQEGVGPWLDGLHVLDGTKPLSDAMRETEGKEGVETSMGTRTPHIGMLRVGEGMYADKCGDVTSVGVPGENYCDSRGELLELEIKVHIVQHTDHSLRILTSARWRSAWTSASARTIA